MSYEVISEINGSKLEASLFVNMDETSEQTAGAVTREFQLDRQKRDINLLPTEREAIKTAKILAKKASRRGKMSYVTKLLNNVNKQVSENGEPRQVDFNIQSLKKAMTSFRDFSDEYVENLEASDEIDRAFTTLLSTEDTFQQCIEAAESYLAFLHKKLPNGHSLDQDHQNFGFLYENHQNLTKRIPLRVAHLQVPLQRKSPPVVFITLCQ